MRAEAIAPATPAPPPALRRVLYAWFLTFAVVMFEPAPFDALFPLVACFALMSCPLVIPARIGLLAPCLLLFIVANLLSVLGAEDMERAAFYLPITLYMVLFALFIALLVYNYGYGLIELLMASYMVVAVMSSLLGIAGIAKLLPEAAIKIVTYYGDTRARALFKDPNVYSPFLILPLIYALHKLWGAEGKKHLIRWGIMFFILGLGVLVSFSRAAWISAMLAIVGYVALSCLVEKKFQRFLSSVASFAVLMAIGLILMLAFTKGTKLADFIEQRSTLQAYDTGRFENQQRALRAGLSNVFGIGPGQSEIVFLDAFPSGAGATHSLYMRTISEYGVPGILALLGILAITASKSIRLCFCDDVRHRSVHCVFAVVFFSMLVNSLVIDTLHWRHFFFILGVIWGLSAWSERKPVYNKGHSYA